MHCSSTYLFKILLLFFQILVKKILPSDIWDTVGRSVVGMHFWICLLFLPPPFSHGHRCKFVCLSGFWGDRRRRENDIGIFCGERGRGVLCVGVLYPILLSFTRPQIFGKRREKVRFQFLCSLAVWVGIGCLPV